MEAVTSKRRGRPRVNLPVSDDAAKDSNASPDNAGIGEACKSGFGTQTEPIAETEKLDWLGMIEYIKSINSHSHRVSLVIHPDANGLIITDNMGNIASEKGIHGYQLNTGEIIRI